MAITDGVAASVGIGATVNLFLGRASEFPGGGQPLTEQLFLDADAPGLTVSMLQNVGSTPLAPVQSGTTINAATAAGVGPKLDEDLIGTFAVPVGARQALNVTNATAAAIVVRYRNFITP
jgi:hypothetical protein